MKTKIIQIVTKGFHYFVIIPLITLIFLEIGLQVMALFMDSKRELNVDGGGDLRIVTLGDSNTYGLYLPREDSYPAQLEKQWNRQYRKRVDILNFGYPGTNSTQVRRNLAGVLREFKPNIVLLTVGANDWWTDPLLGTLEQKSSFFELYKKLRVYKLYYMVRRIMANEQDIKTDEYFSKYDGNKQKEMFLKFIHDTKSKGIDGKIDARGFVFKVDLSMGKEEYSREFLQENFQNNIQAMHKAIEQTGAKLVLMTYASDQKVYGYSNTLIRKSADQNRIPLIDIGREFSEYCSSSSCSDLFFEDLHPTAKGYAKVAEIVAHQLPQLVGLPIELMGK